MKIIVCQCCGLDYDQDKHPQCPTCGHITTERESNV